MGRVSNAGYESSAKDKAADKRKGIKEGGKRDKAIDAKAMRKKPGGKK
jgi:hypothetical protein